MKRTKTPKQDTALSYRSYGNQHAAIDAALKWVEEVRQRDRATEGLALHDFTSVNGLVKSSDILQVHDLRLMEAFRLPASVADVKALRNQPQQESKVD